ncbi:MAG: protein-tyrosine phosphatase family protein [Verrucomicrobiota bacterium]
MHCEAGLGRTGTMIAMLLLAEGASPDDAISQVRAAQPAAIETAEQLNFLANCSSYFAS